MLEIDKMFESADTQEQLYAIAYGYLGRTMFHLFRGEMGRTDAHQRYEHCMALMRHHLERTSTVRGGTDGRRTRPDEVLTPPL